MNSKCLAKNYPLLTPEERFRLDLAARSRNDDVERDRLAHAGPRLTLSMPDHAPYADAFRELALLVFLELMELAALFHDTNDRAGDILGDLGAGEEGGDGQSDGDAGERPAWQRSLDLAHAAGFVLRTKAEGWKRFCERLTIPPFQIWQGLPGLDRLQRALSLAEVIAFTPEDFLRWMNKVRPSGQPALTNVPLTGEGVADATAELFTERVKWWGG